MRRRRRKHSALYRLIAKFLQSRTVLVALGQGIIGGVAAATAMNPALANVGWLAVAKSVLDIWLRAVTKEPIGKGQP